MTGKLHAELVDAGRRFLASLSCSRVQEVPTIRLYDGRRLHPDLHGEATAVCAVLEAKASRADLLRSFADYESLIRHRKGWSPVAQFHYIIVPSVEIARWKVPFGWGLLEWDRVVVRAPSLQCRMKRTGNWNCPGYGLGGEKAREELYGEEYRLARRNFKCVRVEVEDSTGPGAGAGPSPEKEASDGR